MPNVYYHRADLDGLCSAAIAKKFVPNAQLCGMDYNDKETPPPSGDERVYMLDFSLQPIERMITFADLVGRDRMVWIDHHKSAIEEAKRVGLDSLPGAREIGKAACELTWEYFSDKNTPLGVVLLGGYDVWDLSYNDAVLPFQYAMRSKAKDPESSIWDHILDTDNNLGTVQNLLEQGEAILEYVKLDNEKYLASCGFETTLDGYRGICLTRLASSQTFEGSYDPAKHDMMVTFVRQTGKWRVSLFSTKDNVDCSAVAKKYGGGGHKGAAGFITETLPFLI